MARELHCPACWRSVDETRPDLKVGETCPICHGAKLVFEESPMALVEAEQADCSATAFEEMCQHVPGFEAMARAYTEEVEVECPDCTGYAEDCDTCFGSGTVRKMAPADLDLP